jgi:hypothetical protein
VGTLALELTQCPFLGGGCRPGFGEAMIDLGITAITTGVVGLAMLIGGAISWGLSGGRRRDRADALVAPCSRISMTASTTMAAVVGELCF